MRRRAPSVPDGPDTGGEDTGAATGDDGGTSGDAASGAGAPVPAGTLAVASLTLGALAVVLGATLVWFFIALPFGLLAVGCALVERRRVRAATGRSPSGVVTAGLILGLASIPISLGALVVMPRAHDFARDSVRDANGVVSSDLDRVERTLRREVDALDRTLTKNVDDSTASLSDDFHQAEADSQQEITAAENRLDALVAQAQRDAKRDTSDLERSLRADLEAERLIIRRIESDLSTDLANTKAEVARLKAEVEQNP